jgi:hypothetical protein
VINSPISVVVTLFLMFAKKPMGDWSSVVLFLFQFNFGGMRMMGTMGVMGSFDFEILDEVVKMFVLKFVAWRGWILGCAVVRRRSD